VQIGNHLANPQYLSGDGQAEDDSGTRSYNCLIPLSVQQQSPSVGPSSNYLPLFKYRAADTLKPLPVQILTRVQLEEGGKARVLARISVNPSLSKPLSSVSVQVHVTLPDSVALTEVSAHYSDYKTAFLRRHLTVETLFGVCCRKGFVAKPRTGMWNPITKIAEWRLNQLVPGQKEVCLSGLLNIGFPSLCSAALILEVMLCVQVLEGGLTLADPQVDISKVQHSPLPFPCRRSTMN
jgi:hypothetical protein